LDTVSVLSCEISSYYSLVSSKVSSKVVIGEIQRLAVYAGYSSARPQRQRVHPCTVSIIYTHAHASTHTHAHSHPHPHTHTRKQSIRGAPLCLSCVHCYKMRFALLIIIHAGAFVLHHSAHTHTYTHTYTHTHTHTHTHT
jgi:hypothetical protein